MAIFNSSSTRRRRTAASTFLLMLLGIQPLWATLVVQSNGVVTQLPTGSSPLGTLTGIVTDFSGNLFFTDTTNSQIVKIASNGNTVSVLPITGLSPALSAPRGLAIDSAANLYIADTGNSRVVEVTAAGVASVISTPSITLNAPQGVAVDVSGNIFISDTGNSRIVKIASGGTAAVFTISSLSPVLSNQRGIAVDPLGNLYIADTGNSRVVKVSSAGTAGTIITTAAGTAFEGPTGVAVGNNGLLYIADTGNGRVVIVDSQGVSHELLYGNPVFNLPRAVAVSPLGAIYVVDNGGTSNAGRVQLFQSTTLDTSGNFTSSVGFPHVQLGAAGTSITIPFGVGSSSTLTSVNVYTGGVQNLDFTIADDSTCTANTTSTPCTVDVTFTPNAAGLRRGALALTYTSTGGLPSGTLTVPLYGVADAPVSALSPAVASVINIGSTTLNSPFNVAVDAAGNTYVTSYTGGIVVKSPAGGGSGTPVSTGSYTLSQPTGVAVDAGGNLFIADYGHNRIVEVPATGSPSLLAISGLSQSITLPTSLSFDGAGNLYVTDYGGGRMIEVNPYGQGTVLASGSVTFAGNTITGSTVDTFGNVYVVDRTNNRIVKINPLGEATILSFSAVGSLSSPAGVGADPSGNIYVMDSGHQRIIRITTSRATSVVPFSGATIGSLIFGITPDATGNILVADWSNNRLVKVNVSQSALAFASTNVGSASSDSPKTTTVTNLGDQTLAFSAAPSYTLNFPENSSDTGLCTSSTTLAPGALCDVAVKFTPQTTGSLSANIAVTNNTLNVSNSTQQIAVSGTGAGQPTATSLTLTPSAAVYGQAVTITATVADTVNATTIPTGTVSFVDVVGSTMTQLSSGVTLNSSGVATLTGVVLHGVGAHSITASYPGGGSTFIASNHSTNLVLGQSPVTVTGPSQPPTVASGQAGSITVTVAGSYPGLSAPSGAVSYTIVSAANVTVASGAPTLTAGSASSTAVLPIPANLAPGTYVITMTYAGDANYQAPSAGTSVTLHIGQLAATTSLVSSRNPSLVNTAVTFTSTTTSTTSGTPTGSVSFYDGTTLLGAVTLAPTGLAAYTTTTLAAGSHSITAAYSGDTVFPAVTSSAVVQVVQKATAATVLVSSRNPSSVTNAVTFTSTTTSTTSGTPTGSVSFYDGTTLLAAVALSPTGQAAYTTTTLTAGSHSITAAYAGDTTFSSETSAAVVQVVQGGVATTALVSTTNPSIVTSSVTFTATTTSSNGTPTGSVSFYDGTTLLGAVTLSPTGHAAYTTATLAVGSHSITAAYSGDTAFSADTSSAVVQVVQSATAATALVSSANPIFVTSAVSFTATTTSSSGTPTGSVSFYDGTTLLGTAALSSGQALYTTTSLPVGTNSITAVYSGDSKFASDTSAAVAQVVQDFTVTTPTSGAGGTPTATVAPGGAATYALQIGPAGGTVFPAPVTLTLSGLPPGATGTLSPQTLPAGSGLSSVTLTIQLPQPTAELHKSLGWLTPALALLLLPFGGRMRRNARAWQRCGLALILLLAGAGAMAGLSGCGAKGSGFFGQPEQTYVVLITATSGPLSHSTSVTLTVQ